MVAALHVSMVCDCPSGAPGALLRAEPRCVSVLLHAEADPRKGGPLGGVPTRPPKPTEDLAVGMPWWL